MTGTKTRTLLAIEIATHCVPDLTSCVPVYTDLLDYCVVDEGRLPESLAIAWNTPAMTGMAYALLQPASGAEVYLRFIETGRGGGYWPPVTQGWIATEMLTLDPDAVLEKLSGTAFMHIGSLAGGQPLWAARREDLCRPAVHHGRGRHLAG